MNKSSKINKQGKTNSFLVECFELKNNAFKKELLIEFCEESVCFYSTLHLGWVYWISNFNVVTNSFYSFNSGNISIPIKYY